MGCERAGFRKFLQLSFVDAQRAEYFPIVFARECRRRLWASPVAARRRALFSHDIVRKCPVLRRHNTHGPNGHGRLRSDDGLAGCALYLKWLNRQERRANVRFDPFLHMAAAKFAIVFADRGSC